MEGVERPVQNKKAVKRPPLNKAPTNRTESVEVLVERPVYPTKPCQPTEAEFAQSPNMSKLAET